MAGYDRSLIRAPGKWRVGSLVVVRVVRAGSVKAEEELGKQLIVIRRRTFSPTVDRGAEHEHNCVSIS